MAGVQRTQARAAPAPYTAMAWAGREMIAFQGVQSFLSQRVFSSPSLGLTDGKLPAFGRERHVSDLVAITLLSGRLLELLRPVSWLIR
jgi:hypothetical protein